MNVGTSGNVVSMPAAVDMSSYNVGAALEATANGVQATNASKDRCVGFLAESGPATVGHAAAVQVGGVVEAIAAGAIAVGAFVFAVANGQVDDVAVGNTDIPVGIALEASTAANQRVKVRII